MRSIAGSGERVNHFIVPLACDRLLRRTGCPRCRQIAEKLYISERTAQTHVQHILTKLGFSADPDLRAPSGVGRSTAPTGWIRLVVATTAATAVADLLAMALERSVIPPVLIGALLSLAALGALRWRERAALTWGGADQGRLISA